MRDFLEQYFGATAVEGYVASQFRKINPDDAQQVLAFIEQSPIASLSHMPASHRYYVFGTMAKAAPSAKRADTVRLQRAAFKLMYANPYPAELEATESARAKSAIDDMRRFFNEYKLDELSHIKEPEQYKAFFEYVTIKVLEHHGCIDKKPITLEFDDRVKVGINEFVAASGVLKANPKIAPTMMINLISTASHWQAYNLALQDISGYSTQDSLFKDVQEESRLSYDTWLEHRGKLGDLGEVLMMHNRLASQFSHKMTQHLIRNKDIPNAVSIGCTSGIITAPNHYAYISGLSRDLKNQHVSATTTLKAVGANVLNAVRASTHRVS